MIVRSLVLVAALCLSFVGLYHTLAPTRYQAVARMKLEESKSVSGSALSYDPYLIQNEIELIRSEQVLGKVRERLSLRKNWGGIANPRGFSLTIGFRELEVTPFRGTKFFDIRAAAANAEEAAKIANAIVDACQKYHRPRQKREGLRVRFALLLWPHRPYVLFSPIGILEELRCCWADC